MSAIRMVEPLTVHFTANLNDTAVLVGLVNKKVPIRYIVYSGEADTSTKNYIQLLNLWLEKKKMPRILFSQSAPKKFMQCPLRDWGWADAECRAAIQLEGLPLPPN